MFFLHSALRKKSFSCHKSTLHAIRALVTVKKCLVTIDPSQNDIWPLIMIFIRNCQLEGVKQLSHQEVNEIIKRTVINWISKLPTDVVFFSLNSFWRKYKRHMKSKHENISSGAEITISFLSISKAFYFYRLDDKKHIQTATLGFIRVVRNSKI